MATELRTHRLFVGLPIPSEAARQIQIWAESAYEDEPVRITRPEQMHVTLCFYPTASAEQRDRLADLVASAEWSPIIATTGSTAYFGRNALALKLELAPDDERIVTDRMLRPSVYGDFDYHERLRTEPLGQLVISQGKAELERWRRSNRRDLGLNLHLTFVRVIRGISGSIPLKAFPPIRLSLQKLALFESYLGQDGSRYEILAESQGS